MLRLIILALLLSQSVIPMKSEQVNIGGIPGVRPIVAPGRVNWWQESALPGQGGNIVLYGHNTDVFEELHTLRPGVVITLTYRGQDYGYTVRRVVVVDSANPVAAGRWIGPAASERLTLVTCFGDDDHLIVLAK